MMKPRFYLLYALGMIFMLSACGTHRNATQSQPANVVYVKKAPPKPRYEKPRTCRRGQVWVKGHWKWNGHAYVWVKGHCTTKKHGMVWVPGHWKQTAHGWKWVPGHWRR